MGKSELEKTIIDGNIIQEERYQIGPSMHVHLAMVEHQEQGIFTYEKKTYRDGWKNNERVFRQDPFKAYDMIKQYYDSVINCGR